MTITVVQTKSVNAAWTGSFSANITSGNTVFLFPFQYNAAGMSSNSPTIGGSGVSGTKLYEGQSTAGGDVYGAVWMLPNLTGGVASFGLTNVNGTIDANVGIVAIEVSGLGSAPVLDSGASPNPQQANAGTGTIASGSTGNITSAPEIIVGTLIAFGSTPGGPGAPWTSLTASSFATAFWQVVTSSGSSFSLTGNTVTVGWHAGVAAVEVTPSSGISGTVQPRSTVPVPRRQRARGVWAGSKPFTGFVAVAAPRQQPQTLPRRTAARAYVRFTPVTTTNAASVLGPAGTVPVLMVQRTEVISRVTGRVVRR